jgi:hypothetical protein
VADGFKKTNAGAKIFKHQHKKIIAIYNYCSGCRYICIYYSMAGSAVMFLAICYFIFAHQTIITGLTHLKRLTVIPFTINIYDV